MRNATLVFLINRHENKICLGMKKRGFGSSRWNGFGGKVNEDENIEDAAIREVFEETSNEEDSGIVICKEYLNKVASLNFIFPNQPDWNQQVHVFFVETWEGNLNESDEMRPEWFEIENIPYDQMWSDDIYWLPRALTGENINGEFSFNEKDELIDSNLTNFPLS